MNPRMLAAVTLPGGVMLYPRPAESFAAASLSSLDVKRGQAVCHFPMTRGNALGVFEFCVLT